METIKLKKDQVKVLNKSMAQEEVLPNPVAKVEDPKIPPMTKEDISYNSSYGFTNALGRVRECKRNAVRCNHEGVRSAYIKLAKIAKAEALIWQSLIMYSNELDENDIDGGAI